MIYGDCRLFCTTPSIGVLAAALATAIGGSGRRHNHISTLAMLPRLSARAHTGMGASSTMAAHTAIVAAALHLARRLTKPPAAQLRSMLPNRRCCHSHACMRGELRAAQAPAISTNTVVGKPGTKMPITPMAKLAMAPSSSNQRSTGLRIGQ